MKCRICGEEASKVFETRLLKKYDVSYFECANCKFLQPETPYWLDEAYKSSMNLTDTGILVRNNYMQKFTTALIALFFDKKAKFLDYSGGYGVFTRMMRDTGFDYYWSDKYTQNLLARGFEYAPEMGKLELVTAFEVFEHFDDPIKSLEEVLGYSNSVLFTTLLAPIPAPAPESWWYYGLEHGQHIALYRKESLAYLAKRLNKNFASARNVHIITDKKVTDLHMKLLVRTANLLYPLAKNGLSSRHGSDMDALKK